MDSQTRKRSFFSYALDFLFLTPFVAFAAGEILALLLWKLAARTLQKFRSAVICSLLSDSNRKDETVHNKATKTAVNHQPNAETNYHLQQNATLKIGCVTGSSWPLENTEFPVSGEKSQVKRNYFKGEVTQSQKNKRRETTMPEASTVYSTVGHKKQRHKNEEYQDKRERGCIE